MEEIIRKEVNVATGCKFYLKKVRVLGSELCVYAVLCYWNNTKEADVTLYQSEEEAIEMYDFLAH